MDRFFEGVGVVEQAVWEQYQSEVAHVFEELFEMIERVYGDSESMPRRLAFEGLATNA